MLRIYFMVWINYTIDENICFWSQPHFNTIVLCQKSAYMYCRCSEIQRSESYMAV